MTRRTTKFLLMVASSLVVLGISAVAFAQEENAAVLGGQSFHRWLDCSERRTGHRPGCLRWRTGPGSHRRRSPRRHRPQPVFVGQDLHPDDPRPGAHRVAGHLRSHHRLPASGQTVGAQRAPRGAQAMARGRLAPAITFCSRAASACD